MTYTVFSFCQHFLGSFLTHFSKVIFLFFWEFFVIWKRWEFRSHTELIFLVVTYFFNKNSLKPKKKFFNCFLIMVLFWNFSNHFLQRWGPEDAVFHWRQGSKSLDFYQSFLQVSVVWTTKHKVRIELGWTLSFFSHSFIENIYWDYQESLWNLHFQVFGFG